MVARRLAVWLAVVLPCTGLGFAQAGAAQENSEQPWLAELHELELKTEKLLYKVPLCESIAEEADRFRRLAAQVADLDKLEIQTLDERKPLPLASGEPWNVAMMRQTVSGEGSYPDVHAFLSRVASASYRLLGLEALEVKAVPSGRVRFSARLLAPCYDAGFEPPEPAQRPWTTPEEAEKWMLNRMQQRHALLTELHDMLQPERVTDALAALDFKTRAASWPVALSAVKTTGETVVLEGALMGEPARAALEPVLAASGLRVAKRSFSPQGRCQSFVIQATLQTPPGDGDVTGDNGLFDDRIGEICSAAAAPPVESTARQVPVPRSGPEAGPWTLKIRDLGVAEVFFLLFDLIQSQSPGQLGFLVAPGFGEAAVQVSLNAEAVALEDVLTALRVAGVAIDPIASGSFYRISPAGRAIQTVPTGKRYTAERITMVVHDLEVTSVLCSLAFILDREIAYPRDLHSSVSLYVAELPADQILEEVLAAARLKATSEGERLLVGSAPRSICGQPDPDPAPDLAPTPAPVSRLVSVLGNAPAFTIADIDLVGLARGEEGWKAYIHALSRRLRALEVGDGAADGRVTAIDADGVTFERKDSGEVVKVRWWLQEGSL